MSELKLYRNLPFKDWHKSFDEKGGRWFPGGYRYECSCPYGSHRDAKYLDYRDPFFLNTLLDLKKGQTLLIFSDTHEVEKVTLLTFDHFIFHSDWVVMIFTNEELGKQFKGELVQFGGVRWVAVIPEVGKSELFPAKKAGIHFFVEKLSELTDFSVHEINKEMERQKGLQIPGEMIISIDDVMAKAPERGIPVHY
jgi:hypothetical protein